METRELTCIGCPMGCLLHVQMENGAVVSVSGNTCRRGDAYARRECVAPVRTVTGTVRLHGGEMLPVKTDGEVPKTKVLEVAASFAEVHPDSPVHIGDTVVHDVCGTGVDVVATANQE